MLIRLKSPGMEVVIIKKLNNFPVTFIWQRDFNSDFLKANQIYKKNNLRRA